MTTASPEKPGTFTCPPTMDFDQYFEATEQAYAGEKEEVIHRISKITDVWEETSKLDEDCIERTTEMNTLKRLVCRGNLQILRSKEEALQTQLKNSLLRFHVRQLQAELIRLIPHSEANVPSTEFHMSLDRAVYTEVTQRSAEPDEPLRKELKALKVEWEELNKLLDQVLTEETEHYDEDLKQWTEFVSTVEKSNVDAHKMIDTQLAEVTKKLIQIQAEDDKFLNAKSQEMKKVENKIKRLTTRKETAIVELETKLQQRFIQIRKSALKQEKELKRRLLTVEKTNKERNDAFQVEKDNLEEKRDFLLDDLADLKFNIKKAESKNAKISERGEKKISELEAEFNSLVSAATAINDVSNNQSQRILDAVASAVGHHARSALNAEEIAMSVSHMNRQLNRFMTDQTFE